MQDTTVFRPDTAFNFQANLFKYDKNGNVLWTYGKNTTGRHIDGDSAPRKKMADLLANSLEGFVPGVDNDFTFDISAGVSKSATASSFLRFIYANSLYRYYWSNSSNSWIVKTDNNRIL